MAFTPQQLSDLESIRGAALRYCHGLDRLQPDVMKSAYWPDAIDEHGVFVGNAWEFVDFCMEAHRDWQSTMHCIFNHSIELDADGQRATGEIYNVTFLVAGDGRQDTWHGRYLDEYTQRDGEWRISRRTCVHESTSSASLPPMGIDAASFVQGGHDRG